VVLSTSKAAEVFKVPLLLPNFCPKLIVLVAKKIIIRAIFFHNI